MSTVLCWAAVWNMLIPEDLFLFNNWRLEKALVHTVPFI